MPAPLSAAAAAAGGLAPPGRPVPARTRLHPNTWRTKRQGKPTTWVSQRSTAASSGATPCSSLPACWPLLLLRGPTHPPAAAHEPTTVPHTASPHTCTACVLTAAASGGVSGGSEHPAGPGAPPPVHPWQALVPPPSAAPVASSGRGMCRRGGEGISLLAPGATTPLPARPAVATSSGRGMTRGGAGGASPPATTASCVPSTRDGAGAA